MPVIITKDRNDINDGEMEVLPQTKSKNGYLYTLIKRNAKAAIYSMVNEKYPEDTSVAYEVFQVIVTKPYSIQQKNGEKKGMWYHYPMMEKFPSNEDFGNFAWAYNKKSDAMARFEELSK